MGFPLEHSGSSLLPAVIIGLAVVGCGSQIEPGAEGGGGVGGGAVDEPAKPDLFACGLPIDCIMDIGHLGETITPEMMKCESDLALGGEGVQQELSRPGPYAIEIELLKILRGEGTAIVQSRSRCTALGACAEQSTPEWRRSAVQRCDVVPIDLEDPSRCGEGEEACFFLSLTNCVDIDVEIGCDDVAL